MVGRIVSIKMNKTAVVLVTRESRHPIYKKKFTRTKKYLADDRLGVKVGDIVEVEKVRPISKLKHWSITKVIGRDIGEVVAEQLQEAAKAEIAQIMPEEEEIEEQSAVSDQIEEKEEKSQKKAKKGKKKSAS